MRYSAEHKQQTRERLLNEGGALVKERGFASLGVDALMKAVGLSGAAFYGHFPSKDAFFAELIEHQMANSALRRSADAGDERLDRNHLWRTLQHYLSLSHVEHPESGCALPALGAEIARADEPVREQVEQTLGRLQRRWADALDGNGELAWGALAQCVGGLLLARMMASEESRKAVLEGSRQLLAATLQPNAGVSAG